MSLCREQLEHNRYNMCETIKEVWEKAKNGFVFGTDYIDLETDQYIVICPFIPKILHRINSTLTEINSNYKMAHCVCYGNEAFAKWYNTLYRDGRVKTFFFRKDMDLQLYWDNQPLTAEFTGWVDFSDSDFLYFAHLVNNRLATGSYGGEFWDENYNCSKIVVTSYENEAEIVNNALHSIFDELFRIYDLYVESLESTLHNFLEKNE